MIIYCISVKQHSYKTQNELVTNDYEEQEDSFTLCDFEGVDIYWLLYYPNTIQSTRLSTFIDGVQVFPNFVPLLITQHIRVNTYIKHNAELHGHWYILSPMSCIYIAIFSLLLCSPDLGRATVAP